MTEVLKRYVDRMNAHDVKGIADCWVEGGIFDDESAKLLTGKPGYCVGKKKICVISKGRKSNIT